MLAYIIPMLAYTCAVIIMSNHTLCHLLCYMFHNDETNQHQSLQGFLTDCSQKMVRPPSLLNHQPQHGLHLVSQLAAEKIMLQEIVDTA